MSVVINFRIEESEHDALKAVAKDAGYTVSQHIRKLIKDDLVKREQSTSDPDNVDIDGLNFETE